MATTTAAPQVPATVTIERVIDTDGSVNASAPVATASFEDKLAKLGKLTTAYATGRSSVNVTYVHDPIALAYAKAIVEDWDTGIEKGITEWAPEILATFPEEISPWDLDGAHDTCAQVKHLLIARGLETTTINGKCSPGMVLCKVTHRINAAGRDVHTLTVSRGKRGRRR